LFFREIRFTQVSLIIDLVGIIEVVIEGYMLSKLRQITSAVHPELMFRFDFGLNMKKAKGV